MSLINLQGIGWLTLAKRTLLAFGRDRMQTYAAALAFRTVLAIFPFLLLIVAVLAFLGVPEFFDWLRQQAALALPEPAMEFIDPVIDELSTRRGGVLLTGVIVALWTASLAIRDLMHALNNAYEVQESRPFWKIAALCLGTTLAITALLLTTAALMLLGPHATDWLVELFDAGEPIAWIWAWLRWPVICIMLLLVVALLYYVTPDVEQSFRFVSLGSLVAVPVWVAASIGFSAYVRNVGNYGALYGGLGAIIILLIYFYVSSLVFLLGAEVNAVIEHSASDGKQDGARAAAS